MENFIVSVSCVTPIFLLIMLGYYTRANHVVPKETFDNISKICFNVLLPLMMFNNVYSADISVAFSPPLILYLIAETIIVFLIAFFLVRHTIRDTRAQGIYIQNAFRSNIAVIGISLAQILMDENGVASMTMAITVLVPLFNALSVIALEICRGQQVKIRETVRNILKNPLILGALLGGIALFFGLRIPFSVRSAIKDAGKAGSVMTLLALGASFRFIGLKKNGKRLLCCVFMRLMLVPALVLGAAVAIGMRGNNLAVIMICTGSPLATTTYPMALVYESDYELAGSQVVVSSILCCFTMMATIFLLKEMALL